MCPFMYPYPPSSPSSSDDEFANFEIEPMYSPNELTGIIQRFYSSLTKMHFDASHLKYPPPGGWPNITPRAFCDGTLPSTLEVMRQLPYFDGVASKAFLHYKCKPIDYSLYNREDVLEEKRRDDDPIEYVNFDEEQVPKGHFFCLAAGAETGGRDIWLNTREGEITEKIIGGPTPEPVDIKDYFDSLIEAYNRLEIIPCPERVPLLVKNRVETHLDDHHTVYRQAWPTDFDIRYLKQTYQVWGWPRAAQMDDIKVRVDRLVQYRRVEWESSSHWDTKIMK